MIHYLNASTFDYLYEKGYINKIDGKYYCWYLGEVKKSELLVANDIDVEEVERLLNKPFNGVKKK